MEYKNTYLRILILRRLGISKIVCLSLITTVQNLVLNEIPKIQKTFYGTLQKPKIIYKTLCNTFEEGGLKNVEIKTKIISLQSSWIK